MARIGLADTGVRQEQSNPIPGFEPTNVLWVHHEDPSMPPPVVAVRRQMMRPYEHFGRPSWRSVGGFSGRVQD